MKSSMLLGLLAVSLFNQVEAKPFFGTLSKYINNNTNEVIEIGSNDIENGRATYFNYASGKKETVQMSDVAKSTRNAVDGVKAGEIVLANVNNTLRYCDVIYVFENAKAQLFCKVTEKDGDFVYYIQTPRYRVTINDLSILTKEVPTLHGFSKGDSVELQAKSEKYEIGKKLKITAIFENGDALVETPTSHFFRSQNATIQRGAVEKVSLDVLAK